MTLSDWNLVLPDTTLIPIPRTRSSFQCGHHNVNSLSLSISGKDYQSLQWSLGHSLHMKNGSGEKKKQIVLSGRHLLHHLLWLVCWFKLRNLLNQIVAAVISEISEGMSSHSKDGDANWSLRVLVTARVWLFATDELYPSTHQRLKEIPLKDPLSFKQPRTSRAAFIFKAYPVTKDTSAPRLHYMWSGCKLADVSASLCPSAIHAV